jgi:hypothetical protein
VRFVVVDADPGDTQTAGASRLPGSKAIITQPGLVVYQLPG